MGQQILPWARQTALCVPLRSWQSCERSPVSTSGRAAMAVRTSDFDLALEWAVRHRQGNGHIDLATWTRTSRTIFKSVRLRCSSGSLTLRQALRVPFLCSPCSSPYKSLMAPNSPERYVLIARAIQRIDYTVRTASIGHVSPFHRVSPALLPIVETMQLIHRLGYNPQFPCLAW